MSSDVRSRKKNKKKGSPVSSGPPDSTSSSSTEAPNVQSLSMQLTALRERISDDSTLYLKYEQALQSEIKRRSPPEIKCNLLSLCLTMVKFCWVIFLALLLTGAVGGYVVYRVDSLWTPFSLYAQENLYDVLRLSRLVVLALQPFIPRLIKPCIIPNPFSPAYSCACMDGISIRNRSLGEDIPGVEAITVTHLKDVADSTIDLKALGTMYHFGGSLQTPCSEFGAEPLEEGSDSEDKEIKYEVYFKDLFKSKENLRTHLEASYPWKAIWQECDPSEKSVMSLLESVKAPRGYEFVGNPVVYASGQWGRYYHMPELWSKEPLWILVVVLHGGLRITIDGSQDCMEYCFVHKNMVLGAGDALMLHESSWQFTWQAWDRNQTVALITSIKQKKSN